MRQSPFLVQLTVDQTSGGFIHVIVALCKHGADILIAGPRCLPYCVDDLLRRDGLPPAICRLCGRHAGFLYSSC